VESDPKRYFVPPYVGVHGWIGISLEADQDWSFVAELIEQSYRMTAPKRLIKALDDR
jgi:predicted DNA-binding protein (MmcQ/YjbR family)